MILNFPWWHLIAAGFLVGVGWGLASSVFVTVKGMLK